MLNMKKTLLLCLTVLLMTAVLTACGPETEQSAESVPEVDAPMQEERTILFDSETIHGDDIDSAVFADNDVTQVNLWATWCGPCVEEMPGLQEIHAADNGIGIVGIVADTFDTKTGERSQDAVDMAKEIAEKTGVEYPLVIPDADFMENNLKGAAVLFPMSFLVDRDGKVIQGPIGGARSVEEWLDLVDEALEQE